MIKHKAIIFVVVLCLLATTSVLAGANDGGGGVSRANVPWGDLGVIAGYLGVGLTLIWKKLRP